jgi:hypothetical protein
VLAHLLITPAQVCVQLAPVRKGALDHPPRRGAELIGRVFDDAL